MGSAQMAPLLGVLVGVVLALTGAGGGIIAVPLLVFGLGLGVAQAGPVGLLSVGLSSFVGAALGLRARTLRYRAAAVMATGGLLLTPVGLWLAQRVPNRPLTVLFALVLSMVAVRVLVLASRERRGIAAQRSKAPPCQLDPAIGRLVWTAPCARALLLAGAVAGFLSGLLGVGGGFVIVPTLLAVTDLPMKAVVATSMGVLTIVSTGAVINAGLAGHVDWTVAWPFAAGALAGMLAGRLLANRAAGAQLQQGFAVLSLAIAAALLMKAAA